MDEIMLAQKAALLKTMAHSSRLHLLVALARGQGCDVTTLIGQCGQPQPYVSQQLRILREAGLVAGEKHGLRVCYRLADPQVIEVLDALGLLDRPASARWQNYLGNNAPDSRRLPAS